jgi:hypothetical protein
MRIDGALVLFISAYSFQIFKRAFSVEPLVRPAKDMAAAGSKETQDTAGTSQPKTKHDDIEGAGKPNTMRATSVEVEPTSTDP